MGDERDDEDCLSRVARDASLLTALSSCDGMTLSELAESVGKSESNTNRTVNRLADHGLVDVNDGTEPYRYSLTFLGRQFADWIVEGRNLIEHHRMYIDVPADASLPRWVVSDGTVAVATADDVTKHRVFDQVLEFISWADRFHVVTPVLTRDATFYHVVEQTFSDDLSIEMTFPESFLAALQSRFPDEMDRLLGLDDADAYGLPEDVDVPYGFGLGYVEEDGRVVDAAVAIVCYDDRHHSANGTVVNETPEAVAWAEQRYEAYRSRATRWTAE